MATWPTLPDPSMEYFAEEIIKPSIFKLSEDKNVYSRPTVTSQKKVFTLGWKYLKSSELSTLATFLDENFGSNVTWTHPDGTSYTVLLMSSSIQQSKMSGHKEGEITYDVQNIQLREK